MSKDASAILVPNGKMPSTSYEALAASSGNKAHVWQPFSKEHDFNYFSVASESKVYCVQWNQNNKVIVSGGQMGIVTLNYNKDGALMGTLPKDIPTQEDRLSAISSIAFSRGSKLLAAGCMDSSVRVWDLKQQVCKYFLESHKAAVTYVTFSTDDQYLASACLTGEIHLHTVKQTSQAAVLRTPGNRAKRSLHFTPLEPLFASGAEDGSLYVWDTTTYTLLDSYIQTHSATVSRVCFSPGSPNILISAGLDRAIVLTDRRLDAAIATVACSSPLTALDCKDDGNCITVGNTTGRVQLLDPRKLQTPFAELTCLGAEPVSCLHWQQAAFSSKASMKAATSDPAAASLATPGPPRSVMRGQELLSAASPATPIVPQARHSENSSLHPERPNRSGSAASERSMTNSEASFLSALPGPDRFAGSADSSEHAATRPGSRLKGEQPTQNGGLRPAAAERPESRNPLYSQPEAPMRMRNPSEAARLDAGHATTASAGGAVGSAAPSREPTTQQEVPKRSAGQRLAVKPEKSMGTSLGDSERQLSGSNPGFDVDVLASPRHDAQEGIDSAASFGARLKRLMSIQAEGASAQEAGSNGAADGGEGSVQEAPAAQPPHSSADWGQIAEGIKGAISSDIKTLHFEMIRQFHIQQAEMKELVETLASRQDSLFEEVAQLRTRVQQLSLGHAPHSSLR